MLKINHKQLRTLLKAHYQQKDNEGKKIPLLCYGSFGLGKSQVVKQTAVDIAQKKEKIFVEWNKVGREQKELIMASPEKYFVFLDIRLSEFDSSDIKGLPDFKNCKDTCSDDDSVIWKSPYFTRLLRNEKSDGFLFFDEINLAVPLVISSVYKIIYDRVINEDKINDNWLILGAGNKEDDRAHTFDLASPVKDRGSEVELSPPTCDEWISDFAIPNNLDNRIIGFLNWKPSYLRSVNFDDNQKFTTERGWARLNALIKGVEDYGNMSLISCSAIGEGIAREFVAFCKISDKIRLEEVIKNPEILKQEEYNKVDTKYFLITAIAERYKDDKDVDFKKIMAISKVLDENKSSDFVTLLWRLCVSYNSVKFQKDFIEKELNNPLRAKYNKYLVGD